MRRKMRRNGLSDAQRRALIGAVKYALTEWKSDKAAAAQWGDPVPSIYDVRVRVKSVRTAKPLIKMGYLVHGGNDPASTKRVATSSFGRSYKSKTVIGAPYYFLTEAGVRAARDAMMKKNPQNLTSRSERVIQHLVRKCGMSEHAAREAVGKQKGEGSDRPALTPDGLAIYEKAVKRVIRMAPYRAIFLLLPRTGLRIGEMVTMTWDRLDRARGVWIVVGKNSDVREVPVTRDTWKILDQYCAEYNPKSRSPHWVFPRWKGPDHVSTSRAGSAMRALRHDDKRLEALTPHVLRHTFATQKLHECASPEELRRVMGHRGKAVAMLYYHL